jgi:hypothetical protein
MKTSNHKTFKVSDSIEIECSVYETRSSWGHIADIHKDGRHVGHKKYAYYNRTWERFEFESVIYSVIENSSLTKKEKEDAQEWLKNYEPGNPLRGVAAAAMIGEIFRDSQKEKNDWKTRIFKAGIPNLDIPEDWDTLSEDEKEIRLDKVILEILSK